MSPPRPVAGGRGVWALAWPGMALFALHALVGVVDFVFVSSLGTEAVAAVGVATQIHFFSFALLSAVSAGTVAVAAREWERGDPDEAASTTRCSVALSVGFGALLMLAIPWSQEIVSWLGVRAEVAALKALPRGAERNAAIAEGGWVQPHLPKPWGRASDPVEQIIIAQEFNTGRVKRPQMGIAAWIIPSIVAFGTRI